MSHFSKQTVVFASVVVLLIMFLFPVVVVRLFIVSQGFDGLHPSQVDVTINLKSNGTTWNNTDSESSSWAPVPQSTLSSGLPDSSTASPVPQSTLSSGLPDSSTASPVPQSTLSSGLPDSSTASPVPQSTLSSGLPDSSTASPVPQSTLSSGLPDSSTASPVSRGLSDSKIRAHNGLLMKRLIQASSQ
ncbi:putative protein TPRXL [Thrips palmi]|uniref:Uncharacterized protein n=1 Tax=Thrips palmi TaxID=161013 RepID=A0A6P8Z0W7_THRPL|nr:putative protein TPRXL [Thrips palmi]